MPSSRIQILSLTTALTLAVASPAFASTVPIPANPPQSKCVTATTKATHASYVARLEKDVAPYASNESASKIIQTYRDDLDTAWDAMEEPYCGAGIYGISPFIKSYNKSVERARAAFIAAIAKLPKDGVKTETVKAEPVKIEPVKTEPVAVKKIVSLKYDSLLQRGSKSDLVMQLQKDLTSHFGVTQDDSIITGFFGPKTEALVIKFQLEKKIISSDEDAGAGLVGPKTRALLNAL